MSISKPPAARPNVADDGVRERTQPVPERTIEPPRTSHATVVHAPPPAPAPTGFGLIFNMIFWSLLLGGSAAGWYFRAEWWPRVAPYIGLETKAPSKPPARVVPVVTAVVQQKDMDVYINGLGTVTAFKTVTVRSRVEGELVNVAFTEGQMVKEGDLLAQIDRRPFDVQLQQAEGQLARDEATLKSADFTFKRYQELQQSKSIAPQQVDEQRSLVQQTTGVIQSDQAAVANAKLQLDYCHIVAPITGRIGLRLVDQGNIVRANDPSGLAVITQLQPISLVFTIPQDDISRVQKASQDGKELSVTAYDRDLKIKLADGKLLAIDNQVDSTTGTVRLKAVFQNDDGLLFPNQFVNARLLVATKKSAIVVPTAAVQRGPNNYFVYVAQTDDSTDPPTETVDQRPVTPGLSEGAETAIEAGLSPGEIVVTEGLDKLQKGAAITTNTKEKEKGSGKDDKGGKEGEGRGGKGHGKGEKAEGSGKPDATKSNSRDSHAKPTASTTGSEKKSAP